MSKEDLPKTWKTKAFDSWIPSVNLRNGSIHIVAGKGAGKGAGKTVALHSITRYYGSQQNTYTIIVDSLPNWIHSFDKVPYFTVKDTDVKRIKTRLEATEDVSVIITAREYAISKKPFQFLEAMLKAKTPIVLFHVELQEIDRFGIWQAELINYLYQKQRIKAKYWSKENLQNQYVIISEETEAVFENLDRRALNRFRKQYSEMANLRIAMISCSQRIQEVSTKYRAKVERYLVGRTSLEDYDLKLRRLLRHSKHREDILHLPSGIFLDTKSDTLIQFSMFKQVGKPYEIKPKLQIKQQPKKISKLKMFLTSIGILTPKCEGLGKPLEETDEQLEEENQLDEDLLLFQKEFED